MYSIEIGKPYIPALRLGEGVRFNIDESGCSLIYGFDTPTPQEIAATKSGQAFEIRFLTVGGIIWVLSKCGNLGWTDAPYNPRLSSKLPDPASIADGSGLGLTLVMIDSRNAVVKSGRLIGLGTEFSRTLLRDAYEVKEKAMTMMEANISIDKTMRTYTTYQLAEMAPGWARFKL